MTPMHEIDWKLWIPPRELPNTGKKTFKAGQVWASYLNNGNGIVVRILSDSSVNSLSKYYYLAGCGLWLNRMGGPRTCNSIIYCGSPFAHYAVLIQDVGQSEPTDPDILYQAFYK